MKYSANITVKGDSSNLLKLFKQETKEFQNKRASYSINEKSGDITFNIKADDSTALRAVINSITKNLTVYEKTKWIIKQKKK